MSSITRRRALGVAASAAAGLAAGRALTAPDQASAATVHGRGGPEAFDEVYQGRRIQGGPSHGGHGGGHHGGHGDGYSVRIDGEELHVMRNADGTWISVINHYEPLATPRAVARAAVRELQGAPLVPLATA
ncbi:tyrosinase [Streptomyces sp. WAC05374]|uniref:apotyrosinase chaperone MelC1 n=1 Tax=Streptomyces sp. WAC05374 TaxID=2487420 RepID=UPI000F885EAC|nr:tyrosinase cofactor [Streptomyces sp. WAC05374]RST11377.1 tyrosinase [Streptomyces sp. WAC05374]TDF37870.1 tyrosinase [Streptomyces sp. WAC05374]TDF52726.1 tyrosinase [Streptomyces sp. WAC05374]TDF54145.1 tyrosinase [Streptomyces sp. WAC05374]